MICHKCNKELNDYDIFITPDNKLLYECIDKKCTLSDKDILIEKTIYEYEIEIRIQRSTIMQHKYTTLISIDEIEKIVFLDDNCYTISPCIHYIKIIPKQYVDENEDFSLYYSLNGIYIYRLLNKIGQDNDFEGYENNTTQRSRNNVCYTREVIPIRHNDGNSIHVIMDEFLTKESYADECERIIDVAIEEILKLHTKIDHVKEGIEEPKQFIIERTTSNRINNSVIEQINSTLSAHLDSISYILVMNGDNIVQVSNSMSKLLITHNTTNYPYSGNSKIYEKIVEDGIIKWRVHELYSNFRHGIKTSYLYYFDGFRQNRLKYMSGLVGSRYQVEPVQ